MELLYFLKKVFPVIGKPELSSPQKKNFRGELSELEKEKQKALKKFLIFWEIKLSSSKIKKLLKFQGTCKP